MELCENKFKSGDAIDSDGIKAAIEELLASDEWTDTTTPHTLIVAPVILSTILSSDNDLQERFLMLATKAKVTLYYRVGAQNKQELVLLKRKFKLGVTIAVGDGGNDAMMISAADIGIAIAREAARGEDTGSLTHTIRALIGKNLATAPKEQEQELGHARRSMAALVCDVSIARFGFLPRLLHLHCTNFSIRFFTQRFPR